MLYSAIRFPYKSNLRNFEVEAISSSKLEKISFTGPWLHFLEASHRSGRRFSPVFGALLIPLATWSSSSAARI